MNRAYRLVWNERIGAWVAASENCRSRSKRSGSRLRALALVCMLNATAAYALDPAALPSGGQIAAGAGSISQNGAAMTINQASERLITNWSTFNIGGQASVNFVQPGSSSVALNRVLSSDPSQILGTLSSNGQVFLINPSGVIFGKSARVDVGGLVASTLALSDQSFLNGTYNFSNSGGAGAVVNEGQIKGTVVALIGPRVINEGTIKAPGGSAVLAAGDRVSLDFVGDGLINVAVDRAAVNALVEQKGLIQADGGRVVMTARAAGDLMSTVVNNEGLVLARGLTERNGSIFLDAGPGGGTRVAGTLDVTNAHGTGGRIVATGDHVQVAAGATLDASGKTGGGEILLGGSWQNTKPEVMQATAVKVGERATIRADALDSGSGGTIVAWADVTNPDSSADVRGQFSARGGANGGNGGRVETSAASLYIAESVNVDTRAPLGTAGEWLIDPTNIVISQTSCTGTNCLSAATISSNLGTGNVTIQTASAGSEDGDITVSSPITKTAGGPTTLTLQAHRNVIVNADIASTSGPLGIVLSSGHAGGTLGGINVNGNLNSNGGNILIGGAAGTSTYGIGFAQNINSTNPAVVIEQDRSILSHGGNITINGRSNFGSSSGNYSGTRAGVYVMSGATVMTDGGNLYITGESAAGTRTFGFAVEANSNTVTRIGTSAATGHIVLHAVNSTSGASEADRANGAFGLVNNGSVNRLQFFAPAVGEFLALINGTPQATSFTYSPNVGCAASYPNCGFLKVPGSNSSYLYAVYNVVNMATNAIYVFTGDGSRTYDGSTLATGLTPTTLGAPAGYTTTGLAFRTPSRNAGTYQSLLSDGNPTTYTASGINYSVGYYPGTYTITPRVVTASVADKVYDGTTQAAVSAANVVAGDNLTLTYTSGQFASKNVGTSTVTVSGLGLAGADAANYTLLSGTVVGSASITPRTVSLMGNRVYDATTAVGADAFTLGNVVAGEALTLTGAGSLANKNVGADKAVTLGTLALANGANGLASNYTLSGGIHRATITPALLTVSGLGAQDRVYDATTAATLTGTAVLAGVVAGDAVTVAGSATVGAFADRNAGANKAVTPDFAGLALSGADAGNYVISGVSAPLTATITPAPLTVSGLSAQDRVYDATMAATLTGAASIAGVKSGDAVTLTGLVTSGSFSNKNAGADKPVTADFSSLALGGADAGNYRIAGVTAPLTATITPAPLTVSGLSAQDRVYDATTAATLTGTAALTGVIAADAVAVSGSATAGTFADKNAAANKAVTADLTALALVGLDAGNYQITGVTTPLTATITPASLTVSGLTAQDRVYDGTSAAALTGTARLAGVIAGDAVALAGSVDAGTFADKNAGANKAVTAGLSGLELTGGDAGNYLLGGVATPLTATITPAPLTISGLTAQDRVYDATTAATVIGAAVVAGLIVGDAVTLAGSVTGGTFADKNAGVNKAVTADLSGLSLNGADAANYLVTGVSAPLTASIAPAPLTVSGLTAQDRVYDATTAATLTGEGTVAGVIAGDAVALAGSVTAGTFADKNVGVNKAVAADLSALTLTGADAGNYLLSGASSPLTATITPAPVTVSGLSAQDRVYDATTAATLTGTAVLTGVFERDAVAVSGSATAGTFANKNAGANKAVTPDLSSFALSGADAANYRVTGVSTPLTATITPAAVTVSGLSAQDRVYDATTAATLNGTASVVGVIAGDVVTLAGAATAGTFADKNAGLSKAVAADLSGLMLNGADAGNYRVTGVTAPLSATITPAAVTISGLSAQDRVYDATTAATLNGTASVVGVIAGDVVTAGGSASVGTFAHKNAGVNMPVTADLSGIALSGADAGNYLVSGVTTPLAATITPAPLTVSGLSAQDRVYDATTAATLTGTAALTGVIAGDAVAVSGSATAGTFADKTAGANKAVTADLTGLALGGLDGGNYQITGVTTLLAATITPAPLTVSGLSAQDRVYDATTAATLNGTASVAGVIAADVVSLGGTATAGAFADKNAGANKGVTADLSGLTLTGTDAGNYLLSGVTTPLSATITPAPLTVSGLSAQDRVYDATTVAALTGAASIAGVIAGDAVTLSGSANAGAFSDKNAGANKAVAADLSRLALGGADAGNYQVTGVTTPLSATITPAPLTVSGLSGQDRVYDATAAATVIGAAAVAGVIADDAVTLAGSVTGGTFSDKNAGVNKAVTADLSGVSLNGADAGNYVVTGVTTPLAATITPAPLTVSGLTAHDRVYDATTAATLAGTPALSGVIAGDAVTLGGSVTAGAFAHKNAGANKAVTPDLAGLVLGGADAGNYQVTGVATPLAATITPAPLTVSGLSAHDRVYDATTAATLSSAAALAGVIAGDAVTLTGGATAGTFADSNPGANKPVTADLSGLALGGADAGNYQLTGVTTPLTATIMPAEPVANGVSVPPISAPPVSPAVDIVPVAREQELASVTPMIASSPMRVTGTSDQIVSPAFGEMAAGSGATTLQSRVRPTAGTTGSDESGATSNAEAQVEPM